MLPHRLAMILFFLTATVTAQATPRCADLLGEDFDREFYVEKTAHRSIPLRILQSLSVLKKVPPLLRGLTLPILWFRVGNLGDLADTYGQGLTRWGIMEIWMAAKDTTFLKLLITPMSDSLPLNEDRLELLKELFPDITYDIERFEENEARDSRPRKIVIKLRKPEGLARRLFETTARSLVNTVVNDPMGVLGLNPPKAPMRYRIPSDFDEPFFLANAGYFSNFGPWEVSKEATFSAVKKKIRPGLPARILRLVVDLDQGTLKLRIENLKRFDDVLIQLRKVAWLLLDMNYDTNNLRLPSAAVADNVVTVKGLPLTKESIAFLRRLERMDDAPLFDRPLTGLKTEQLRFLNDWVIVWVDKSDLSDDRNIHTSNIAVP